MLTDMVNESHHEALHHHSAPNDHHFYLIHIEFHDLQLRHNLLEMIDLNRNPVTTSKNMAIISGTLLTINIILEKIGVIISGGSLSVV